jgi:hypothetical protein
MENKYGILPYAFEEMNSEVFAAAEKEWGIVIIKRRDFTKLSILQKELVYVEADKIIQASEYLQ